MSITTIDNPVVTHYLTEDPRELEISHNRHARLCNIAAKTSLAAAIALLLVGLAISVVGTAFLPVPCLVLGGMYLALPISMFSLKHFTEQSKSYTLNAELEHRIVEQLDSISTWKESDFNNFCDDEQIPRLELPRERLNLIARYHFWKNDAKKLIDEANDFFKQAEEKNKHEPTTNEEKIKLINEVTQLQLEGLKILETRGLTSKINSVIFLELITNPFQEINLKKIGIFNEQETLQRMTEIARNEKAYFLFHDFDRPTLTIDEIKTSDAAILRQRLFGN